MFKIENIIKAFQGLFKNIKDFLLKPTSREFFIFLFFFVIASGFWLLQTLNDEYDKEFKVPLTLINLPDDVVLTNDQVEYLDIKAKDKGTILLNYAIGGEFSPISIDYHELAKRSKTQVKLPTSVLLKQLQSKFNASTELTLIQPDSLEFIFAKAVGKKVPVRLQATIESNPQYMITDTIITPDSVTIYAPLELLDKIQVAKTEEVSFKDITDSTSISLPFEFIKGVKYVPNEVLISLPTDILTEKTIKVPIRGINFPTDKELRTFPSQIEVTFQVGTRSFNNYTAKDFSIEIDYNELINRQEDTYPVNVIQSPSKIRKMRVWPRVVDFLIEQNNLTHD